MTKLTLKSTLSPEMQAKLAEAMGASSPTPQPAKKLLEGKPLVKATDNGKQEKPKKPPAQMKKDWKGRLEKIKAVQAWMQETWPALFNLEAPKPLKRHIEQEIINQASDRFSNLQVRRAIRAYTTRKAYLEAVLKGDGRYDLQGNKVEDIKENEQAYSQQTLEVKAQQFEERRAEQKQRRLKKLSRKAEGKAVDKVITVEPSSQEG
jgi:sRNA-binding protein